MVGLAGVRVARQVDQGVQAGTVRGSVTTSFLLGSSLILGRCLVSVHRALLNSPVRFGPPRYLFHDRVTAAPPFVPQGVNQVK
jgi:hypothetical protein